MSKKNQESPVQPKKRLLAASLVSSLLAACGGGDDSGTGTPPPSGGGGPSTPSATVTGTASKGLLLNAIVNFYAVTNGVVGTTPLATTRTSATTGTFSSSISSSDPVVATLTVDDSTLMRDEISGNDIPAPAGLTLHAVFPGLANLQPLAITPLTELAYQLAIGSSGGLTVANINSGNSTVSTVFLDGAPVLATHPIDIANYSSATPAQQAQAKLLTALAVAAEQGIATGGDGLICAQAYPANIPCLVGGLDELVSVSGSAATLTANASYLTAAYSAITAGAITLDGGTSPAELGMDVATTAETALVSAISEQNPLPGYNPSADPLQNTKDLIANLRTNTVTQWNTDNFGLPAKWDALTEDFTQTVSPLINTTSELLAQSYHSALVLRGDLPNDEEDEAECHENEIPPSTTCEGGYGESHEVAYSEGPNPNSYEHTAKTRWIELTITRTGDSTYSIVTLPVEATRYYRQTCDANGENCQYEDSWQVGGEYVSPEPTPVGDLPELTATMTLTKTGDAYAASISGRYYVTPAGGSVQANLQAAQSVEWNEDTLSGSITASGTISDGQGGVSLVEAKIGDNTILHLLNAKTAEGSLLWQEETEQYNNGPYTCDTYEYVEGSENICSYTYRNQSILPTIKPGSAKFAAWGEVELTHFRTTGFHYAGKVNIAEPVYDKSGIVGVPASVTATASVSEIQPGGALSQLFTGSLGTNVLGVAGWDATLPFSDTNFLTAQLQVAGTLTLSSGRVLTVSATANADRRSNGWQDEDSNDLPWLTADHPASFAATYRYVTSAGVSELHAEATFDHTHGLKGSITNNAGVVINVMAPVVYGDGSPDYDGLGDFNAVITANGVETATIDSEGWVFYSDGSSESLL